MVFATASDPLLAFAFASGLVVMILTVALFLVIIAMRFEIDHRRRRESIIIDRWQQIFFHAVEDVPVAVPRLTGLDRRVVLLSWLQFVESIRGESRQRLIDLALTLKLDQTATGLVKHRNTRLNLLGIVALGRLQSAQGQALLVPRVGDLNAMTSLLAARSLLQINPQETLSLVLEQLVKREDWPKVKVAAMLMEVPELILAEPLLQALSAASAESAARLLGVLEVIQIGDTWPVLEPLLQDKQSAQVLTSALKVCRDPRGLPYARTLARHREWIVRAQAATTLGQIGNESDLPRLMAMISDSEWWVRYRAGLALAALPFIERGQLEQVCSRLEDRFAVDIMKHVLAETGDRA